MIDLFSLEGRTALVTGGSRGIGAAVTTEFLKAGARVIVGARGNAELDAAVAGLATLGRVEAVVADLSSLRGVQALMAEVAERTDRLDVLVNHAGARWGAPLADDPEVGWGQVVPPDVRTLHYLTVAALPLLRAGASAHSPARVINIGPVDDNAAPSTGNDAYAATSAAVHRLTRQHAKRLADEHILVNAIASGPSVGGMGPWVTDDPDARAAATSRVPPGRLDRSGEIGGSAVYLASRAGAHTTGTVMVCDGRTTGLGRADALLG